MSFRTAAPFVSFSKSSFCLLACALSLQACKPPTPETGERDEDGNAIERGGNRRHLEPTEVKLGTVGDNHPLPAQRNYESLPARLMMNAPYQAWSDQGSLIHAVAFTPELQPCAQADFYYNDRHIGRATESGDFSFRRRGTNSDYAQDTLRVACKDRANKWYRGELLFHAHQRTPSFERPVVYVHADRGVYRPGQTIRIRVLAWKLRGEYRPEARRTVTIFLQNSQGQEVGGARVFTDDDGIGTLDIPLPSNMPSGDYKLIAETQTAAEADREGASPASTPYRAEAPIQVRVFETPVIELRHTLGEFLTPAMHNVSFDVSLRYLDGATFSDGRLEVTLKHGELKNLEMPAMTMVFKVKDAAMLDKVRVGSTVKFIAAKADGAFVVTAIDSVK